eukprot:m.236055 g.236055  ORF g.236055 m.236055 type:complete len:168 (+) comp18934_c3_seq1:282-785(+)
MSTPSWAGRPPLCGRRKQSTSAFVDQRDPMQSETSAKKHFEHKTPVETKRFPKAGPKVEEAGRTVAETMRKPKAKGKRATDPALTSTARLDFTAQKADNASAAHTRHISLDDSRPSGPTAQSDATATSPDAGKKSKSVLREQVVTRRSTCLYPARDVSYTVGKGLGQ